jgi:hippurate hydrolase
LSSVEYIQRWHAELTALRRDLHMHPELGFEEHRTARIVCERLAALGIEHHAGIGKTGVVAVIRGHSDRSGRAVGLRADMDALPMQEENGFAHRSRYDGRMHGCGHDGHTTMLLAAARYLHETRNFDGTAFLIFQPGEEGYAGAKAMIEDGLFERFPAEQVFALHNWPALPPGSIGITPGPAMAAADRIEITIDGRGGHGAHPHAAIDPVLVAGHIITAAQSIVSRNVSPIDTAVVSLCAMQAGNPGAMSVIPSHARLVGTVRTFRPATQDMIERRLRELVGSIAAAFGASATLDYQRVYPATINHDREAELAATVAEALVGSENVVRNLDPSMGSEDFSFMLQAKPGAFARLGQGGAESGCFLHNSTYDFNDAVIPLGAAYLAALAERAMPAAAS